MHYVCVKITVSFWIHLGVVHLSWQCVGVADHIVCLTTLLVERISQNHRAFSVSVSGAAFVEGLSRVLGLADTYNRAICFYNFLFFFDGVRVILWEHRRTALLRITNPSLSHLWFAKGQDWSVLAKWKALHFLCVAGMCLRPTLPSRNIVHVIRWYKYCPVVVLECHVLWWDDASFQNWLVSRRMQKRVSKVWWKLWRNWLLNLILLKDIAIGYPLLCCLHLLHYLWLFCLVNRLVTTSAFTFLGSLFWRFGHTHRQVFLMVNNLGCYSWRSVYIPDISRESLWHDIRLVANRRHEHVTHIPSTEIFACFLKEW